MTIAGYLSDYSLPELLYLLETGNRTGFLRLEAKKNIDSLATSNCSIWFKQGRVISAFGHKQGRNLVQLMHRRKLIDQEIGSTLLRRSPVESPFGLFLKSKGLLTAEQLKLLFSIQVIGHIRTLFTLEEARFKFFDSSELPYSEMTGINIPATEVILPGLRSLRNWTVLENRLPNLDSGLLQCVPEPTVRLKLTEQKVWSLSDGKTSLQTMAKDLEQPSLKVQQVAFCLIYAGLVEEVPIVVLPEVSDDFSLFSQEVEGDTDTAQPSETNVSLGLVNALEQYLSQVN